MQEEKKEDTVAVQEARKGLLKAMLEHNLKPKFSSTPIDPNDDACDDTSVRRNSAFSTQSILTTPEREYLESLLRTGDPNSIRAASQRLSDPSIFPKTDLEENEGQEGAKPEVRKQQQLHEQQTQQPEEHIQEPLDYEDGDNASIAESASTDPGVGTRTPVRRRDFQVQQELFRLHEMQSTQAPSQVLLKMTVCHRNSLLQESGQLSEGGRGSTNTKTTDGSWDDAEEDNIIRDSVINANHDSSRPTEVEDFGVDNWNPFKDLSSWLDGSEGVEVNDNGVPIPQFKSKPKGHPFRILGTAADDVSCHPHVLSPPLMESLLAFIPESLTDYNIWLKYSLVRDGASLWTLLRMIRASTYSLLAIETTDGHVLGAFTSQSWRLAQGWYGSKETFLWKMRKSRLETTRSILQQACQESEIQVYPYRQGNVAVQYCSKDCLMLGQGELLPSACNGKHYGHGLYLEASLRRGTTSTSETFGNPCLVDADLRGSRFDVSNIEVWTLTPHDTVAAAEQSELSTLFLEGGRDANAKNLNFMNILVGGPI